MAKNSEDIVYTSEDSEEGPHCVVSIGDGFKNGRYVVQSELGRGHFSTVWLASQDQEPRYVALKIHRSSEDYTDYANEELQILRTIAEGDPENKKHVVKLLDSFEHPGSNGIHICMVLELLGDNLFTLVNYSDHRGVPLQMVKQICIHCLIGLDYLHRQLSMIHADLKPENILLMSRIDSNSDINSANQTRSSPCTRRKLLVAVDPMCKLADFGNSCSTNEQFEGVIQTRQYRCPEVILGLGYSTPADIWSFACICFELVTGDLLFNPKSGDTYNKDEDHLALMMELVGKIPDRVMYAAQDFFDENGDLRSIGQLDYWPLNKRLMEKYHFSERDANDIANFILPMLDFIPEKRPTAAQCLAHPWLNDLNSENAMME